MVFVVGALYPLTCASGIATAQALCGTRCESFHLKKKKKSCMKSSKVGETICYFKKVSNYC